MNQGWISRGKTCATHLNKNDLVKTKAIFLFETRQKPAATLSLKMDAIRKKMETLKTETSAATARVKELEDMVEKDNLRAQAHTDTMINMHRRCHLIEAQYDQTLEKLKQTHMSLEEKELSLHVLEDDCNAMARRVTLLEDEEKKALVKLSQKVLELAQMSLHADKLNKKVKQLEQRNIQDEETTEQLEIPTKEAIRLGNDSEKKLEEMTRRLGVMEDELKRTEERATMAEETIGHLEGELKSVGENMKALEVSEEKAVERQERYKAQIQQLLEKLDEAEGRYEYGEMHITKLNQRIDDLEDEICREKIKIQGVTNELDDVLKSIIKDY